MPSSLFSFGDKQLDLSVPQVMGVINVTPDSFSDGGELVDSGKVSVDRALERAWQMVESGSSIVDIGGESTRPGADLVSSQEEIDRVIPVVEEIHKQLDVVISVDTSNPELIKLASDAGAGLINDVRALEKDGALRAASESGLPVCLMHMQGQPGSMQDNPQYSNVVDDVLSYLSGRVAACEKAGISRDKILLDPGFGFGKTLEHNIELLSKVDKLHSLKLPLLIGMSRKRMIGAITGKDEKQRMAGSLAAAVIAVMQGAWIIRAHDVVETVDALKVCHAVLGYKLTR